MKFMSFKAACFCLLLAVQASAASIVINEIMYHPAPAMPEDKRREWIEIHNPGTNAVDLSGWRIANGVEFTFPTNTVLQQGAYLVIAANRTAFLAEFPGVANVIGDWVGQLSNTGEKIELVDAQGETVTAVRYADSGDWAIWQRVLDPSRGLPSWDWVALHDGQGSSLELINPALPNGAGQNWASSQFTSGTPGAPNSVRAANSAPLILGATHLPLLPTSAEPVTISARLVDEQTSGITGTLFYRNSSSATPPGFSSLPMFDDGAHNDGLPGDGLYGATIPPQSNGTVIEFYIQATDAGARSRTWPAPALDGVRQQTANALYQVEDNPYTGDQPVLRLILTGADREALRNVDPNSDVQFNTTMVTLDGVENLVRYSCGVRIRGAGSRGRPTKNYRVNIPTDAPWKDKTAINLNTQYTHAQKVGGVIAQKAGLPAADGRFVQVRVNGENLARTGPPSGGDGSSWGSYLLVEPINNEFAARIFPTDNGGNVYRASSGGHNANLSYQGTNPQNYISRGYSKTSNGSEDDWEDLFELTDILSNTPDVNYTAAVSQRLNVREWMTYFAVLSLMEYTETALGSGFGDDYAMYRGLEDTRFKLVSHDFDTVFGQGDSAGNINENIFIATAVPAVNRFLKWPDFAPIYYQELYRLATTLFTPEQINPIFDQHLSTVVTDPTLTAMKNFNANRRLGVLNQIPQAIRINPPAGQSGSTLPVVNSYPTTTTPFINLSGLANAMRTRTVLVNGLPASRTPWQGAWNIAGVALTPGINRILVQTLDDQGVEFERATLDIWYDDASVVDIVNDIANDTTWPAAGGPYRITGTINISATLTIQPGATVYFAPNASLLVTGRLLAEGTDTQRILFTREPGSAGRWGGLTFNGNATSPETRIAYAHFEFNSSTALHASDATLFLDHLTFGSTDHQYISLDRSSFVVQDCVFPAITGSFEPVHGTGGIKAGGRGIVRRNFWGKVTGYNDAFDFTGGNRPGPILQVLNNVFMGSDDDLLDLDSTDAWVEGNIFLHTHRQASSPDSSSAISGGSDNADNSQITIIGNIIYDCDQAANAKQTNFYTLLNNTIVHQSRVGSIDTTAAVVILADDTTSQGLGAYLEGNIIYDAENLIRNVTTALVTYTNNIIYQLAGAPWTGPGGNNQNLDPLFQHVPQLSETTNFTTWASAQVMWNWLSLQAGSPARGAGPNGSDQGGVIPLGASIAGEPVGTTFQTSATLTVGVNRTGNGIPIDGFPNGSGFNYYRWRLDGGAWSAETPIATPISLSGLANGAHYVEASGKNDAGFYQDDPVFGSDAVVARSRTWTVNTTYASVLLNEVLAINQSAFAHEGTFPDAVELYNAGAATVDLTGWSVTDDPANRFKFKFPTDTTLASGQYLVLYADSQTGASGLHLGFGLDQAGDGVYLYNPAATLMDSVQFGTQLPDLSIGRDADGHWTLCRPTFGSANVTHSLSDPFALKINEWLANGRTLYPDDFIEIYNPASAPVLLGGLHLTDEPLGWPGRHEVPPLSFMGAGAHFVFIADGHAEDGASHLNFKLSSNQGAIGLFDAATNLIDCISYGPQIADTSEGRRPSGASVIGKLNVPTPGAPNPGAGGGSGTITNIVQNIFGVTDKQWRYDAVGIDRGTAWRATGFDDSGWATGFALFGFETTPQVYPFPFQTTIPSPDQGGPNTAYFRTHFTWTNGPGFSLVANTYIDDGAVFYLNGVEAGRLRITANPVLYTTGAQNATDGNNDSVTLLSTSLVQGDNVLAVEVHQPGGGSSDDVFGMALNASKSITNPPVATGLVLNEVLAHNVSFTNAASGGTNAADWIELFNPSTNSFDLSGLSLSDQLDTPRRWTFPAGASLAGGAYLVVRCDPDAPASTNTSQLPLNTGFGLKSDGGDEVYLFDTLAHGGALMDSVVFGLQVPDYSIGRSPDATGAWRLALPTPGAANIAAALGSAAILKVNEWLANPSGNDDDFFELYNPGPQPVALGGLYLSDSLTNRTAHRIQDLSFIGTGDDAFALFVADGNTQNGADHVNFSLRAAGESVAIFSTSQSLIDAYTFGAQDNGVSEGRFPDGSTNIVRFRGTSTPGRSNLLPIDNVAINEVLTHSDPPFEDAIELRNISTAAVDISGWFLSDRRTDPKRFRIPNGTVLAPGGLVVFYEAQFNPDFTGRPPYFALSSSEGEELFLHTADAAGTLTGFRTSVKFGAGENAVSFGRFATSVDIDFTAMSQRSFGADNPATVEQFRTGTGLSNAYPLVGPVVISEIMYHPPDIISGGATNDNDLDEFIELQNITGTNVALFHAEFPTNTWRLRDAVDFDFPMNVSLPAGGRLLVVGFDPATNAATLSAFRNKYGIAPAVPIYGPWRGKLANDSENIEFYKPDAPQVAGLPDAGFVPYILVDKVKYADAAPWPALADGNTNGVGMSLQRRVVSDYGNDPVNWIAGVPTPGAATGPAALAPPSITSLTAPHDVVPGANDSLVVAATGNGTLAYQWRFNGELIPGAMFATLVLNNFQAANAGVYSVIVVNGAGSASAQTRVDLRSAPIIVRQPVDQIAVTNGTAVFTVAAGGSQPLSYQWQTAAGLPVCRPAGLRACAGDGPALVLANVQPSDSGSYRVVITNLYGAVTSTVAALSIVSPPVITSQPQSTNAFVSQSVTFSVGVFGSPPLRYQWRFNGANISGATNSALTLANLQLTNSGGYSVLITNSIGFALSDSATLLVAQAPVVTIVATDAAASEPGADAGLFTITRSGSVAFAQVVQFTVSGNATPGVDYTALISPVTIPIGSASATLPVNVLDDPTREGNETVTVTLSGGLDYVAGPPASATVVITDDDNLAPSVTLTNPPDGLVITFPATIVLGAVASDADGSVTKVEFFDAGGTNNTLLFTDPQAPYGFNWTNAPVGTHVLTAVATDNLGSTAVSAPVTVVVNAAPTVAITSPSNGAILDAGSNLSIAATASDIDGTITVVEFYEGANLIGSDSSSPFSVVWSNLANGEYVLTAQATDNRGATRVSAPVNVTVGVAAPRFTDNFASRGVITGFTNFITGSNTSFTREAGEPRHASKLGNHSGWLSWTAPASGLCRMDTFGSDFDTLLAVYTGGSVSNLTVVAANDDATGDTTQSSISFYVTNGFTYQIAVDGYGTNGTVLFGNAGAIAFHMGLPNPFPVFLTQPLSQVVNQGDNVTFTVATTGPGPQTLQWRRNGTALNNQTNTTLNRNNVQGSDAGTYTAVASNASGSVTSAPAVLTVRTAPNITTQPQDLVVARDSNAVFTVRVTGLTPFVYQWYYNGAPIADATSSNLVLLNVQGRMEGVYSVTVSNSLGGVVSRNALLTVNDGLVTNVFATLLDVTNFWRYEASGRDLGAAWRFPGYDDSGWSNGVALFGLETPGVYPIPILTPFSLNATNGTFILTYYLRTTFSLAAPSSISGLLVGAFVDDGAVWYLNGREAGRLRIPGNIPVDGVTNSVLAQNPNTEGLASNLILPLTNLVAGENLLAVEVHQSSIGSSDVVFGMAMASFTTITNGPVLRTPIMQPGGVEVTLEGVSGRNYAIDVSTNLINWAQLTIWTNFTGSALHLDTAAGVNGNRFYRGRLVP